MKIKYLEFCQFLNNKHPDVIREIMDVFIIDKGKELFTKLTDEEEIEEEELKTKFVNFDVDFEINNNKEINHVGMWLSDDYYTYRQTILFSAIFDFRFTAQKSYIFHGELYDWFETKTFEKFYNKYSFLISANELNLL